MALTKDQTKITQDIQAPFQAMVNPGRAAGAFSGSMWRVCIDTVRGGQFVTDDYWFDITRRRWSGPHSFSYDNICQTGNYFIISHRNVGAYLFASQYMPSGTTTYLDNGQPYSVVIQTASFPKTQNINEKQVIESTIELSSSAQNLTYTINAIDDMANVLDTTQISINTPVNVWGVGVWGGGQSYNYQYNAPATFTIPWTKPLIFKKMGLQIIASSTNNLSIGTFFAKYKDTGYTNK
jgi:hypothetical protein